MPQNIMYDKRVVRGSTHAAMVIPAGTYPDNLFGGTATQKKAATKVWLICYSTLCRRATPQPGLLRSSSSAR